MQSYMRFFGMEGLGRPDLEIENEVYSLKKYLLKHMEESEIPELNALMVFTDDGVELDAEGALIPAMRLKQVKEFMRQNAKEKKLSAETLSQLKNALDKKG